MTLRDSSITTDLIWLKHLEIDAHLTLQRLLAPIVFIWLLLTVLIGLAVGIGYVLPAGDQMTFTKMPLPTQSYASIYLRDTDRHIDQRLTGLYEYNSGARWSPDGKTIAYISLIDSVPYFYIMDRVGQHKHPLPFKFASASAVYYGLIWSPDSQQALISNDVEGAPQSVLVNVHTGQGDVLPEYVGAGIWSPDGNEILFAVSTENGASQFYEMNIRCAVQKNPCESRAVQLFTDEAVYGIPVWSPDGKAIAFSKKADGNTEIVVAQLGCSELTPACIRNTVTVANTPLDDITPIWSQDGSRLAFVSSKSEIQIVHLKTEKIQTFNTPNVFSFLQDWSPTGKFIAYLATEFGMQTGVANMYLLNVDTGETRPILQDQNSIKFPAWKPVVH